MDVLKSEAASCKIFTLVLFAYWTWTWILELSLWWKNRKEENGTIKNSIKKMEHYPHRRLRKTSAHHRRIKELFCIMFKKLYTCLLYTLILFTLPSRMNLHWWSKIWLQWCVPGMQSLLVRLACVVRKGTALF